MEHETKRTSTVPATLEAFLSMRADLDLGGRIDQISQFQVSGGGFSDVYSGYYKDDGGSLSKVAVKKLRANMKREKGLEKELAKELYVWSKLDHPRILRLEGFYLEGGSYPFLVSKWMDGGTVTEYLETHPEIDMLLLVLKIAEGLNYLHENDVIHSDIKPNNILMSAAGEPVLCDFGLARRIAESQTLQFSMSTNLSRGTLRFMAPELLSTDEVPNSKATDVWAFGMTVYVLLTGQLPYHGCKNDVQVYSKLHAGELPSSPPDLDQWQVQKQTLWHMSKLCWRGKAGRPPILRIVSGLQHAHQKFGSGRRLPLHQNEAFYESLGCFVPPVSRIRHSADLRYLIENDPSADFFRLFMDDGSANMEITLALLGTTPPIIDDTHGLEHFASLETNGAIVPAKYTYNGAVFWVAHGDREYRVDKGSHFSILIFVPELMELVPTSNGIIPQGRTPIHGGRDKNGAVLYHAVGSPQGKRRPGWTAPHIGGAMIGYYTNSYFLKDSYEILCWRDEIVTMNDTPSGLSQSQLG